MQDRRGFFKSIAGLFVVAAVDPVALLKPPVPGLAFHPEAFTMTLPELGLPTIQGSLEKLTRMMHERLVSLVEVPLEPMYMVASKIGSQVEDFDFTNQFGLDFTLNEKVIQTLSDKDIIERYVDPAMSRVASEINDRKARRFAYLPLPQVVDAACRVNGNGISLRGLRAYDIQGSYYKDEETGEIFDREPGYVTRFDVLFSS